MGREELIARVSQQAGLSQEQARQIVQVVVENLDTETRGAGSPPPHEPRIEVTMPLAATAGREKDYDAPLRYFAKSYAF